MTDSLISHTHLTHFELRMVTIQPLRWFFDFLTADNYVSWSHVVSRALHTKNKIGFINGMITKPVDSADPLFEAWERCNHLVVS